MNNNELQDSIIQTNAMLKACDPTSARFQPLSEHFERLLEIQAARALSVKVEAKA